MLIPLDDEEAKKYDFKPCLSPEHNAPTHIVIKSPMKHVCPNCGYTVIMTPRRVYCGPGGGTPVVDMVYNSEIVDCK